MSSSSEYSGFSGHKPAKSPEKPSTFSQTCSLLSQYLKEKGSFGDLTLGMTCNTEPTGAPETSQSATTMNLFPTSNENSLTPQNLTAMDLLSQPAPTLTNSSAIKSVSNKETKAAQMTIFYAGQVFVYDDFPAEKAKELMLFAGKGNLESWNNSVYTYTQSQPSFPPNLVRASADSTKPVIPNVNIIPSTGTNSTHEQHPQATSRPVCDPPIARKASLHRFLARRKDRIAAKAPYQTTSPMEAPNKQVESTPWLGLGAK